MSKDHITEISQQKPLSVSAPGGKDQLLQLFENAPICNGCGKPFESFSSPQIIAKKKTFEILTNIVSENLASKYIDHNLAKGGIQALFHPFQRAFGRLTG